MTKKIIVIGSGAGGLGVSILLAKAGYDVTVVEKNESSGGRGSKFSAQGFQFDMGPSWYLMPDVFQQFFELVGEKTTDYFQLKKLSPSYRIWFEGDNQPLDLFSDLEKDAPTFEKLEPGVMKKLKKYLAEAGAKYEISNHHFIYKPFNSILDFLDKKIMFLGTKYTVFSSFESHLRKFVSDKRLRKILQYPLVFLGTSPYKAPAVYSLMNHVDFDMGVFYPMGGMTKVFEALHAIAKKNGVKFLFNAPVKKILIQDKQATGILLEDGTQMMADSVVSNADYHFTETQLLSPEHRQFSDKYWDKQIVAPSGFLMYLGCNKKFPSLTHHNLFFAEKWKESFDEIFTPKDLPSSPSYYVCAPSVTDKEVAPEGKENLFVLVPVAAGLDYTPEMIATYRKKILNHMTETLGLEGLEESIIYERIFTGQDFSARYNAIKGTALGLAQNLMQTAVFRPKTQSKKISNLYYTGASTNPGIGVPTCLISAQVAFKRIQGIKHPRPLQLTEIQPK